MVRSMVFPVVGQAGFWNDWHAPRDNGERLHLGTDILAPKLTSVLAVVDGVLVVEAVTSEIYSYYKPEWKGESIGGAMEVR